MGVELKRTDSVLSNPPFYARGWQLVGFGNCHRLFRHESRDSVIRIEIELDSRSKERLQLSVSVHNDFLVRIFKGCIYQLETEVIQSEQIQSLYRSCDVEAMVYPCEEVPCVKTRYLMDSTTFELKPKYSHAGDASGESCFVLEQRVRNEPVIYDPKPLFDGKDRGGILSALESAFSHRKRYLKVHSNQEGLSTAEILSLMTEAILTEPVAELVQNLKLLQSYATDAHAKLALQVYKERIECEPRIEYFRESPSLEEFISTARLEPDKFLNQFLLGRTAMDVSLMFSFFRNDSPFPELTTIILPRGWCCCVAVVDTELKPRWRIPFYASQSDEAIKAYAAKNS